MIIKLKNGDTYLDVDTEFSDDQVDTLELRDVANDIEYDTLEIPVDELAGDNYE